MRQPSELIAYAPTSSAWNFNYLATSAHHLNLPLMSLATYNSHVCASLFQTILVIDDSTQMLTALEEMLKDEYTIMLASSGAEGVDLAVAHRPDLILLDILMPDMNGYEVLKMLKADPATAGIAIIFISGLDQPEDEARGLILGGSDFIAKPLEAAIVRARVAVHLRLSQQLSQMERMARIDSLTGISNRRQFDEVLEAECGRAHRYRHPLAVVLLDVDYFKRYNDCYGHAAGDNALHAVAKAVEGRICRKGDMAARYGGEEFALVLPEADLESAMLLARGLCAAVAALKIAHCCSPAAPYVTVSVGVACYDGTSEWAGTPLGLIERADRSLYQAKATGRNRAVADGPRQDD